MGRSRDPPWEVPGHPNDFPETCDGECWGAAGYRGGDRELPGPPRTEMVKIIKILKIIEMIKIHRDFNHFNYFNYFNYFNNFQLN